MILFLILLSCGGNSLATKPLNNNRKITFGSLPIAEKNPDGSYLLKESYDALSPIDFNSLVFPEFSRNLISINNSFLDKNDIEEYLNSLLNIMNSYRPELLPATVRMLLINMASISSDVKQYDDLDGMADDLDQIKDLHNFWQIPIKKIAAQIREIKSEELSLEDSLTKARRVVAEISIDADNVKAEDKSTFIDFFAKFFLKNIICTNESSVNWLYKEEGFYNPFFDILSSPTFGWTALNKMISLGIKKMYKEDKKEDLAMMNYIWVIAYGVKTDFNLGNKSTNIIGEESQAYSYNNRSFLDNKLEEFVSMLSEMSLNSRKMFINSLLKELGKSYLIAKDKMSNIELGSTLFYRIALSASFATAPERFSEEEENRLIGLVKQLLSHPYEADVDQLMFNFAIGYFLKHNASDSEIIGLMIDLGLKNHITNVSFDERFFKPFKAYSERLQNLKNEILNNK